ncbi:MAG: hypothetical protein AAFO29_02660 [Actinomycetota bacterium]
MEATAMVGLDHNTLKLGPIEAGDEVFVTTSRALGRSNRAHHIGSTKDGQIEVGRNQAGADTSD